MLELKVLKVTKDILVQRVLKVLLGTKVLRVQKVIRV